MRNDWKKKVKDSCPCFMNEIIKPTPTHEACDHACNLEDLKILLLQQDTPDRSTVIKTMIKSGMFTRKEIVFALVEIHNTIYKSAERRLDENITEMKKEGFKIITGDDKTLKAITI